MSKKQPNSLNLINIKLAISFIEFDFLKVKFQIFLGNFLAQRGP